MKYILEGILIFCIVSCYAESHDEDQARDERGLLGVLGLRDQRSQGHENIESGHMDFERNARGLGLLGLRKRDLDRDARGLGILGLRKRDLERDARNLGILGLRKRALEREARKLGILGLRK